MVGYYDFEELRSKALNGTQDDLNALGEWFERHGSQYWNGECYDVGGGYDLYPILQEHFDDSGEIDYCDTVGYELRP